MPDFKNKPNECVKTEDGRTIWLSRSCAVAVHIVALDKHFGSPHVLMVKRGPACPDFVDFWCLPCGYMDYDETSGEAARREAWEETGVDLLSVGLRAGMSVIYTDIVDDETQSPWYVNTSPNANRQNITLHHGVVLTTEKVLPFVTDKYNEKEGEAAEIRWVPLQDVIGYKYSQDYVRRSSVVIENRIPVCFNHHTRLWNFVKNVVRPQIYKNVRAMQDAGIPARLPEWLFVLDDKVENNLEFSLDGRGNEVLTI